MDRVVLDRRDFLIAVTGGAALLLFAATRNSNLVAAPSFHVPEVSVAQAKALLDAGAIAIDARDAEGYAYADPGGATRGRNTDLARFGKDQN